MVETLGRASAQESIIQILLDLMQGSFPDKTIDWGRILSKASRPFLFLNETFRFILKCSVLMRVVWENDWIETVAR